MRSVILGAAASLSVIAFAFMTHRDVNRVRGLLPDEPDRVSKYGPLTKIGRWIAELVRANELTPPDHMRIGVILAVSLPVLTVSRSVGILMVLGALVSPMMVSRRRRLIRQRCIERSLPMTVDLLRLGVCSGLNISQALEAVVSHLANPVVEELSVALGDVARGRRLGDALEAVVGRTSEDVRPLIAALVSAERYGAPLATVLERLSYETRLDQERRAEQAARRLSVQLLFPVAGCILPAFALLTVAPLIAGSIKSLAA